MTDKKRIVVVGAGQMGQAMAQLLDLNKTELLGFADNDPKKWTREDGSFREAEEGAEGGSPQVFSVDAAINLEPREIIISVLGEDRIRALIEQLRVCRFYGDVTCLKDIYDDFDIRGRCLRLAAERIKDGGVPGAIAELGVYRGDTAWQLNGLFPDRDLYLFDTFTGFDHRDVELEEELGLSFAREGDFADTSAENILSRLPAPDKAIIRKGYFPDTAAGLEDMTYALVSLDPDLYAPALAGLEYFYPRLSPGGMLVVHDYNNLQFNGVRRAISEFEQKLTGLGGQALRLVPLADLHGTCIIVK